MPSLPPHAQPRCRPKRNSRFASLAFAGCLCGYVCALSFAAPPSPPPSSPAAKDTVPAESPSPANTPPPFDTLQGLLDSSGILESAWRPFARDAGSLERSPLPLLRLLLLLNKLPSAEIHRWSPAKFDPAAADADPERLQRQLFSLSGDVQTLTTVPLPQDLADRFEHDHLHRCQVRLPGGRAAHLYTTRAPPRWPLDQPLQERFSASAVFLGLAKSPAGTTAPIPCFAAPHLAAHPQTLLGDQGMDYALLDRLTDNGPIRPSERDPFFQLLSIAGRVPPPPNLPTNRDAMSASLARLLQSPTDHRGKPFHFHGAARRVTRIQLTPQDAARWGFDHYFELQIFVHLPTALTAGGERHVLSGYPITLCVRELPSCLRPGDPLGEPVSASAFFFKLWSFDTEFSRRENFDAQMRAPLLIGRTVECDRPAPPTGPGWLAIAGFAALALLLLVVIWMFRRSDRIWRTDLSRRNPETPIDLSFDPPPSAPPSPDSFSPSPRD